MEQIRVFLGGTCGESKWRECLIPQINIDFFNPQLPPGAWSDAAYEEELRQREECDILLYVLTSALEGVYSIAEVVDDSNKRSRKTVFCYLEEGFSPAQLKSLSKVGRMVEANGGTWIRSIEAVSEYLNLHDVQLLDDEHYIAACEDAKEVAIKDWQKRTDEDVVRLAITRRCNAWKRRCQIRSA